MKRRVYYIDYSKMPPRQVRKLIEEVRNGVLGLKMFFDYDIDWKEKKK